LLDPLWATNARVNATRRSRTFGKTLAYFLDNVEHDLASPHGGAEEQSDSDVPDCLVNLRKRSRDMVVRLITFIAGDKLATWVRAFLDEDEGDHQFVSR
jgi:hypothetical protein